MHGNEGIARTVATGKVVVDTVTLVGVGMFKQEQAEVILEPMNWDKQFGLPIAVVVSGQLRFIFEAPPVGAEVTVGDDVGM